MSHKVHRFKKVVVKRPGKDDYIIYMCDLPRCRTQYAKEFIVGKTAICHRCLREFLITKARLRGATFLSCALCVKSRTREIELPPIPEILP